MENSESKETHMAASDIIVWGEITGGDTVWNVDL